MSIIVFSKPVHSGKTTDLMNWCSGKKNTGGILMPDMDGCRMMLDLRTQEIFEAECPDPEESLNPLQNIGRFHFYSSSFRKANAILLHEMRIGPSWLVIDEVGKLEMETNGFYPALNILIPHYRSKPEPGDLLLVIRNSLVQNLCSFFEIGDVKVIDNLGELA